ncbi:vacuolar protein sorting-associated protein 11 homolog [Lucilia cuprina]|uniref:vacuolar protein sorting-associated protein 11 homolog n=1 Tax=Lucilia cuprina TaxID=7375 RepID=UPI001F070E50|nr:vacuolar protein sorting-associated protein 11 homolog [Lucilia cuprina]
MFNFFKIIPLNKYLNKNNNIVAYCNNSTYTVFCYVDEVHIYTKDWEYFSLQMKDVKFCCIPEDSDYLILICQHTITCKTLLKIYCISNQLNRTTSTLISNSILECNSKVTALSALNTSNSQICLSIGLENGSVLFYNNFIYKDIPYNTFKYINVNVKPIKGINFFKCHNDINMFVCSDAGVFCYAISKNIGLNETRLILDDMNSNVHCSNSKQSVKLTREQYFVVARDDGLYCYTAEGRGPCYAINGFKKIVECFGKSLIILLKTNETILSKEYSTQLIIIDIDNKIIVLNKEFENVLCILPIIDQSGCLVLLKSGQIYCLKEHELTYKLSHLVEKNLYDVALKILQESTANSDLVSEVLVHYGDHLLQRGDISEAVKNYSKTIGTTSPFLIIKKLIDFRYNEYLIQYLSALVQTEFKMAEHIELLNNCIERVELPSNAFNIFEEKGTKSHEIYIEKSISRSEKEYLILKNLQQNEYNRITSFNELKNSEVLDFFSEYGYGLMKKYPNELKEVIDNLLSNRFLKNYIFHSIILSLSLINKLCAIDFVDKLFKDCEKHTIYNVWIELILQKWDRGNINLNFVIEFFKIHESEISIDNVFILCRNYNFWPGIRMMYDKCSMEILSTRCLANSFEMFPGYMKIFGGQKLNHLWIRTLRKENFTRATSLNFVGDIVRNIIKTNPNFIINVLHSFVTRNDFSLNHLNEILLHENFFIHFKCEDLCNTVILLEAEVDKMEFILHNYLKRPIEFRNRLCDICKQIIKLPALYFLCQHAYHRECIKQYSEVVICILCTDNKMLKKKINNRDQIYNTADNSGNKTKNTLLINIAEKIGQLAFKCDNKNLYTKCFQNKKNLNITSNPFDSEEEAESNTLNEYDANLNPFT